MKLFAALLFFLLVLLIPFGFEVFGAIEEMSLSLNELINQGVLGTITAILMIAFVTHFKITRKDAKESQANYEIKEKEIITNHEIKEIKIWDRFVQLLEAKDLQIAEKDKQIEKLQSILKENQEKLIDVLTD